MNSLVQEILKNKRPERPLTLEEAKLKLQLTASGQSGWMSLVKLRPWMSVGTALLAGALVGRSSRLRKVCGSGLSRAVRSMLAKGF